MAIDQVTVGVVPIHRGFLSMEEAVRQKRMFMAEVSGIRPDAVRLAPVDDVCENGILCRTSDVEGVIAKLKASGADALFLPFCDFGEEVVAARVAAALRIPVLVWGARDERPNSDASRGRDTQCGMFAATKAIARFGVTYSYIHNVPADSPVFRSGFERFVRAANAVKSLKGLKIAQIGQRPAPFMSVIASEAALMEKLGVEVVPLGVGTVLRRMDEIRKDGVRIAACVQDLRAKADASGMADDGVATMAAFKLALRDSVSELGCRGAALECWSAFPASIGTMPCFMVGELTDEGIPVSCETDLYGAVTSVLLEAAALRDSASFFADLTIRHPENDNAELLWHCGPFPYSLRDPGCAPYLADGRGRFPLKKGDITIARLGDEGGNFKLAAVEGKAVDGPPTTGTYAYFETGNWTRVEEKFMFGPYIHHVSGCFGHYARCLREAVRFIPSIEWDDIDSGPRGL